MQNKTQVKFHEKQFVDSAANANRGSSDIYVQKEAGVENVLKMKAGKRNFTPTNLHVYTNDGKVYSFVEDY